MSELIEIGPHRVRHGDLRDEGAIDELMQGEVADFIYGDPPWGGGNLNYWQTLNKKHTGAEPRRVEYEDFQNIYFSTLAQYSSDVVVVEYGEGWRQDIINFGEAHGLKHAGHATSFYTSKNQPLDVHLFSKSGTAELTNKFKATCYNNKGYALVREVFKLLCPGGATTVLDPTCGMGYGARAAMEFGLVFRGNELNRHRLQKTIDRLSK